MAWEHLLANEFKKRNKSTFPPYLVGKVISPVKRTDSKGRVWYDGPLIVSIYDDRVRLQEQNLIQLEHVGQLYKGLQVALLGEQIYMILGVIK